MVIFYAFKFIKERSTRHHCDIRVLDPNRLTDKEWRWNFTSVIIFLCTHRKSLSSFLRSRRYHRHRRTDHHRGSWLLEEGYHHTGSNVMGLLTPRKEIMTVKKWIIWQTLRRLFNGKRDTIRPKIIITVGSKYIYNTNYNLWDLIFFIFNISLFKFFTKISVSDCWLYTSTKEKKVNITYKSDFYRVFKHRNISSFLVFLAEHVFQVKLHSHTTWSVPLISFTYRFVWDFLWLEKKGLIHEKVYVLNKELILPLLCVELSHLTTATRTI